MLIGLQTRYIVKQMQDPCKNKDMLRAHVSLCATKSTKVDLENKETGPVPGKTGFPRVVFSPSPLFWLKSHLERGGSPSLLILPWLLRPM